MEWLAEPKLRLLIPHHYHSRWRSHFRLRHSLLSRAHSDRDPHSHRMDEVSLHGGHVRYSVHPLSVDRSVHDQIYGYSSYRHVEGHHAKVDSRRHSNDRE